MLSKKEIKDIQSLTLKKYRDEVKLFVAEGPKIISELLQLIPMQIEKIYAVPSWIKENAHTIESDKVHEISETELGKISSLQTPNKVLAIVKQMTVTQPDPSSFVLYLDTIQDPGNLGTIIRIADWFNIRHIVCSTGCADLYNPKVIQATMASIARVQLYYDETDSWLLNQTLPIYAATLHGKPLGEFKKTDQGILLIGNESKGIRKEFIERATEKLTIPRKGAAESLNAAVATGIILSHLLK